MSALPSLSTVLSLLSLFTTVFALARVGAAAFTANQNHHQFPQSSSHPVLQLHHFDQKQQHQQHQQQLQLQQQQRQLSLAQVVRFSIGGKADRDKQREFGGTLGGGVAYGHGGGVGVGVGGHEQLIRMPPSSDGTLTRKSATTTATGMLFRPPSPFPGQPLSMAKLIMLRHNQRRPRSPPARRPPGLPSLPSARSRLVEEV
ncbi:hypothetical protein PNOK_0672900 [Pyrrhoderma noxium]|uniref:Uncharacterized protein n=1 Tax=Pyrrhoderma noxium TaxID=2282107 RepID=A0A286UF61_9AGAM|nr:hypothetical protein PNOK_0672900 [Pyrrhoderma noxium]